MGTSLVIVESPAKARTIEGYLGSGYAVGSSVGHVRDLPDRAKDVPEAQRKRFGALGVDVDDGFEPYYVVDPGKKKIIADLKKRLAEADELLLATDEDREGEAIAWHLVQVLKPKVPVKRMVFHEITKDAITRAVSETREIDDRLVDAQETRRILDRLYGYEVSPVLWKKVMPKLSAGRVQSVATRLVVDRERERMRFVAAAYWDILGTFEPGTFEARLSSLDGKRIAQGRDFGETGAPTSAAVLVLDEDGARSLADALAGRPFTVEKVDEKPYTRRPAAPFRTSTLQQEASRKLRFSSQTTMRVAQRLYENGHITYMRTDSVTLSDSALTAARAHAARVYGPETVPAEPRRYERAVANAQEAHEAIRPAGDVFRTPDELRGELSRDEHALYDLIFKRTVASQMKDASGQTVSIELAATTTDDRAATFRASGTVITFPGFLKAYESGRDEPTDEDEERRLPALTVGADPPGFDARAAGPRDEPARALHGSEPRTGARGARYRPTVDVRLDHGNHPRPRLRLQEGHRARADVRCLLGDAASRRHFDQLVDYDFTARLEDDLDRIAAGDEERVAWLRRFYFGDGDTGLHALVTDHLQGIDARDVNSIAIPGSDIVVRVGRYGPYLERGEQRASLPDDLAPDELTPALAEEVLAQPSGAERVLGTHPETGRQVAAKDGRYGPYVTEVLAEGEDGKPRTASLFASMSLDTITLDEAVRLLTLPRTLEGTEGEEIVVANGRYGPFVKRGAETRSLESEEQLLTLTVEQAEALLAQPKQRRGRGAPKAPLKEVGPDPASGKPIVVKDGRFGPYVTDGETNASLRRGDTPEGITLERAVELLAERRAKSA